MFQNQIYWRTWEERQSVALAPPRSTPPAPRRPWRITTLSTFRKIHSTNWLLTTAILNCEEFHYPEIRLHVSFRNFLLWFSEFFEVSRHCLHSKNREAQRFVSCRSHCVQSVVRPERRRGAGRAASACRRARTRALSRPPLCPSYNWHLLEIQLCYEMVQLLGS